MNILNLFWRIVAFRSLSICKKNNRHFLFILLRLKKEWRTVSLNVGKYVDILLGLFASLYELTNFGLEAIVTYILAMRVTELKFKTKAL